MATAKTRTTTARQMNVTRSRPTGTMYSSQQAIDQSLVLSSTGNPLRGKERESDVVAKIMRSRLLACEDLRIGNFLNVNFHAQETLLARTTHLVLRVAEIYRSNPRKSLHRVLKDLVEEHVLILGDEAADLKIKQVLFVLVGYLTFLYTPTKDLHLDQLCIEVSETSTIMAIRSVGIEFSRRPYDEVLRAFRGILPVGRDLLIAAQHKAEQKDVPLHVSNLNVSTLQKMAGIELIWVESIGAHLEFDPTIPSVKLFRFPSVCNIHKTENSLVALMTKDYYNDEERPHGFSFPNMMEEILLSFRLLFRDDRRACKIFQRLERARAMRYGIIDIWLDDLCGANQSTSIFSWSSPVRETYNTTSDFPIFARRLNKIQDYVTGIQPNRMASLWRDRRDLQRWYTIWAVLIIGGISVILAIIQIWLSAAQVGIAAEALKLQKKQSNTLSSP